MKPFVLLQRLQRVVETRVQFGTRIPGDRNTNELDVRRFTVFLPALEEGVEGVAVAAAVPKNFDDFDLSRGDIGRNSWREAAVVTAFLPARHTLCGALSLSRDGCDRSADQYAADKGQPYRSKGDHQRRPWM